MRRQNERGQALVELALVLPILLLVLMGIVDFGRVFHGHLAVTSASRQAAREASLGRTDAEIISVARNAASPLPPGQIAVTVTPAFSARQAGTSIEVTVTYSLQIITPLIQPFFPNPYVVIARAVTRRE
ncbi:MAG: pilus assembly protein [Selenomonadales bacterium]|jgi:Flp pilus assembly protein TadG|nr:pilus assembly protein [Selenomonadales bacterium]